MGRVEILTGPECRRRRTAREKFAIVRASLEPGAVIADVARRFGVTRQQVYQWRSDFRSGILPAPAEGAAVFAQVALSGGEITDAVSTGAVSETVEVRLHGGRVLVVPLTIERRRLQVLIRAVEVS